jgi:hypothetical protein
VTNPDDPFPDNPTDEDFDELFDAIEGDGALAPVVGKALTDVCHDAAEGILTPQEALAVVADIALALMRRATT